MDDREKLCKLIEGLCDTSDPTDEEVRQELQAAGIDIDASQKRFATWRDGEFAKRAKRGQP